MSYPETRDGKHTGRWVGQVRHKTAGLFRDFFERKSEADAYEAFVKEEGIEPPWMQTAVRASSKRTFAAVLDECVDAGGNNGTWHEGRDPAMQQRLRFVRDFLGSHPIDAVGTAELNKLVKRLRGADLSAGTINRYLDAASAVLTYAAQRQPAYITSKPKIPKLKETARRTQVVSDADEQAIVSWLVERGRLSEAACVRFMACYGVRRGELEKLSPEQIDQTTGALEIYPEQTKTNKGRVVFGPPSIARDMRAVLATGRGIQGWKLLRWFQKAVVGCGLDPKTVIHSLRHTTATRMIEAGIPTRIVQEHLGHSSISTTERYAKVSRSALAKAAETLARGRGLEGFPDIAGSDWSSEKSSNVRGLEATGGIEPPCTVLQTKTVVSSD